ncbi:serine protease inhibitor, partial [Vibrio vulnificus]|uniref:serine protease inhibitor n=2 Tax=Gammaproteobacteria TaxID=1236 RepID=UPI001CCEE646
RIKHNISPTMSDFCKEKSSWPELVGTKGTTAKHIIEKENPHVKAILVPEGSAVTLDFVCSRVRVVINRPGFVIMTPMIG